MNQARVGLLVAAALLAMPITAMAQGKPAKAAAGKADKKEAKPIDLDATEKPKEAPAPAAPEPAVPAGAEPGGLENICAIDPSACPAIDMDKAAARDLNAQMYAVQQIYALRYHRVELNPYFGLTMNDQFVSHDGPGLAVNYYILNVLAVGVNGNWYQGLNANQSFNLETSRAGRVGEPINEYQWNANFNVTYVPAYGKFAGFGDFIFHYDVFVLGGAGAISTRPIATIDPDNRTFAWKIKPNGHLGVGLRIFFSRWLSAVAEISDYIYAEDLENITPGAPPPAGNTPAYGGSSLTNNVQAQVGLSIFLPFSWEYRLPK